MKVKVIISFILVFIICGCTGTIKSIADNPIEKKYQSSIFFKNMELALPEGEWTVIGRGLTSSNNFIQVVLLCKSNMNLVSITRDSIFNEFVGYKSSNYMSRNDFHYSVIKNNNIGSSQDGWLINHVRLSLSSENSSAVKEAFSYFVENGYSVPANYIKIYHKFTGGRLARQRYLVYEYYVNPEKDGFSPPQNAEWGSSDWHPLKINGDKRKVEYVEKLKLVGASMHEGLRNSFHGK